MGDTYWPYPADGVTALPVLVSLRAVVFGIWYSFGRAAAGRCRQSALGPALLLPEVFDQPADAGFQWHQVVIQQLPHLGDVGLAAGHVAFLQCRQVDDL